MESHHGNTNTVDLGQQTALPGGPQPWWCSPLFGGINTAKPLVGSEVGQTQLSHGVHGTAGVDKETQSRRVRTDGNIVEDSQNIQTNASIMTPVAPEILVPTTQLELGQSIACAAYPYNDPYFAGLIATYGTQELVHPQIIGIAQSRMSLPIEMTEEPVYVNAKQYHGILRRRQSRAKAELERKSIKARKPYLHESRHLHAIRRARGCGGRFLNTKKFDDLATKTEAGKASNHNASLTMQSAMSSSSLASDYSGQEGTPESRTDSSIKDGNQEQSLSQFSSYHGKPGQKAEDEDCGEQQRVGMLANRPSSRAVAIQ